MLTSGTGWADGIVYTHAHADHIHGIDDLRSLVINRRRLVDVYADDETMGRLRDGFRYIFETPPESAYPPIVKPYRICHGERFAVDGPGGLIPLLPYRQVHGSIVSLGLRVGGLAYSSDVSAMPDESLPFLGDLDVFVVDALRYTPHPSHLSVDEALALSARLAPRRTILTHMHNDLDYATLAATLPAGIEPAYDGMVIELPVP
jgi:phosphoribosyl 1,2-cyclic phosphate phosphodiesterase